MKQAISISLGSSTRDKKVTITLFDEEITIERIGTDGDVEKAIQLYHDWMARWTPSAWEALTWA